MDQGNHNGSHPVPHDPTPPEIPSDPSAVLEALNAILKALNEIRDAVLRVEERCDTTRGRNRKTDLETE